MHGAGAGLTGQTYLLATDAERLARLAEAELARSGVRQAGADAFRFEVEIEVLTIDGSLGADPELTAREFAAAVCRTLRRS